MGCLPRLKSPIYLNVADSTRLYFTSSRRTCHVTEEEHLCTPNVELLAVSSCPCCLLSSPVLPANAAYACVTHQLHFRYT